MGEIIHEIHVYLDIGNTSIQYVLYTYWAHVRVFQTRSNS